PDWSSSRCQVGERLRVRSGPGGRYACTDLGGAGAKTPSRRPLPSRRAPVAQWIEQRFPVRVLPARSRSPVAEASRDELAGGPSPYRDPERAVRGAVEPTRRLKRRI